MVEVLGSSEEDADSMEQSITDQVCSIGLLIYVTANHMGGQIQ